MKCRIVKSGERYKAQYQAKKRLQDKLSRPMLVWCDLCSAYGETILFDTETEAECTLRDYAKRHSADSVVKEFEA